MLSIIITSYKEPKTIGRAIENFLKQNTKQSFEIIVMCGDKKTYDAAKKSTSDKRVFVYRDEAKGKPAALNLAYEKARGEILVLSDGDVYIGENSLSYLVEPFSDKKTGAVCGHPISTNSRKKMLGFWAYVLTETAHKRRLIALKNRKRFFCSGYFFAIRKELFPELPENILSEDGLISHKVYEKGYKIDYQPEAKVYVKYPENFKDWIKQKKRSAGGYNQLKKSINVEIRSFKKESLGGFALFRFVSNIREFFWLWALFFARVYLWLLIYIDINFRKKSHKDIWVRVESTK